MMFLKDYSTSLAPEIAIILQKMQVQHKSAQKKYNSIIDNRVLSDEGIIAYLGNLLPDIRILFQMIKDTAHPNKLFPKILD